MMMRSLFSIIILVFCVSCGSEKIQVVDIGDLEKLRSDLIGSWRLVLPDEAPSDFHVSFEKKNSEPLGF